MKQRMDAAVSAASCLAAPQRIRQSNPPCRCSVLAAIALAPFCILYLFMTETRNLRMEDA
jgi:hypothetical protein